MEIWKDVEGYEGLYQVSNYGRVKSLDRHVRFIDGRGRLFKGKILKLCLNSHGYWLIVLCKDFTKKSYNGDINNGYKNYFTR